MAHFLRAKQAGINNDLSSGLMPELFLLDDVARYGINSRASAIAYDPVQSLLAVGTSETQYGSGEIYIFGQQRVSVTFALPRKASVNVLRFCADKLVSLDSKNEVCVFSLEERKMVTSYAPPGQVTALLTDPCLDYAFIGLQNGEIISYDLDRHGLTPFRLPNFWKEHSPRNRFVPVVSLSFHPRDIGKILIGYPECAVTFSVKQNAPGKFFRYEVPQGAPGGGSDPSPSREPRYPKLTNAIWHPTGTFILTIHEDSSLVFWDPNDGRVVMARTIQDVNVDKPGSSSSRAPGATPGTLSLKEPIFQAAWCCKENPDDTGLLIAGGLPSNQSSKGLTFFDLGFTPNYQTSSWQTLSDHLASPRRHSTLTTPPNAEVVNFCLIPRSSPHYNGAHDPIAILTLLSSGELVTLSFPSGHPISPTNMLHPSLSLVHPFVNKLALTSVDRGRWLGWREKRAQGPKFVTGGVEAKRAMGRSSNREIVQLAHADGIVRIWDLGHNDEIENPSTVQVDVARAIGRFDNVEVSQMSLAGAAGEFSVGLKSGELAVFKWDRNRTHGRDLPLGENEAPGVILDISHRADPGLKEGFVPLVLLDQRQGPVTAVKHSDVGFTCVGYESGSIAIVDLRGPTVIFTSQVSEFSKPQKRSTFRKSSHAPGSGPEWATCIEFGVTTLEGEDYSSLVCFVGTSRGNLATFKIIPSASGYSASFVGACSLDDTVLSIYPINADNGKPATASQSAFGNLKTGFQLNGVVVAVTPSGCRVFKPATSKGAHKSWDDFMCDSAAIVSTGEYCSLVGLFGDGRIRAYSLPALKEISSLQLDNILEVKRFGEARISPTGDVVGWTSPSELALVSVWGSGTPVRRGDDTLLNPELSVSPRPTISNLQWLSGTQFMSTPDMDLLVGGPDRPPSKRMQEQIQQEEAGQRQALRDQKRAATESSQEAESQEGYWAYMQRQVQERTERLGVAGNNMDRLEENSAGFTDDVNKFIKNQKRKAALGFVGSKFGF